MLSPAPPLVLQRLFDSDDWFNLAPIRSSQ